MALTSGQKHYIKKNIKKLSISELASDLGLANSTVEKFARKTFGEEKYQKIIRSSDRASADNLSGPSQDSSGFSFNQFFSQNLNYFLLLFSLVLVCYANAFGNAFVSDDNGLKNIPMGSLSHLFSSPLAFVQNFVHFIAYSLGGLTPEYFRFFNIFFHLGSAFLIFTIIHILANKNVAIIAASIFAVHPIFVESVTWISGLAYAIYAFFFLLSFYFYITASRTNRNYYYSIAAFGLSVVSSEKAAVLFLMFPLYELVWGNLSDRWKKTVPYFALSLVFGLAFVSGVGGRIADLNANYYENASGLYNPLIQVPVAVASYLGLIFWPDGLTLYHTEMMFSTVRYIFALLAFLLFLGLIFWSWKKNRPVFFWLSLFLITLAPTLTPLKIAWIVAERYAYIGTIGIIVSIAYLADRARQKYDRRNLPLIQGFLVLIVLALSVRTIIRNVDWKDEDHLWPATEAVSPSGGPIHNNMGDVYARAGKLDLAAAEFQKATEINPNYADAYHNLANTYQQLEKYPEAIENYQKAIEINPRIWQSYQNIATIYFKLGDKEKALESIKKALEINPDDNNLKESLAQLQK